MGLLDLISPGMSAMFNPSRGAITGMFSGMAGAGSDPRAAIAGAAEGMQEGQRRDDAFGLIQREEQAKLAAQQEEARKQDQTIQWLQANGHPDLASAVQAGYPGGEAFKQALGLSSEDERFYGNVVPMQDAEGNIVLGQASNQGRWQPLQGAEGMTPAPTTKQIDTGTEIITQDIYGNELFRTPKNNREAAYESAFGGAAGKAAAERIDQLPGMLAKSDNMLATIDGILTDPALDVSTGWLAWMQGVPGTDQYRFGQRALQLQGQAFLQAFESLKGGGQITEVEGTKATQAIGRLGTAQSPDDYRAALEELKSIIQAAKTRAQQAAGIVAPGGGGGGWTVIGVE